MRWSPRRRQIICFAAQTVLSVWILYRDTEYWEIWSSAISVLSLGLCVACTVTDVA